ncbi:alpha/beta hydrolase [Agromyces endophyticus]|uniref:alpha/beta fold hydrolase n=1 Tax=Agromyces sp. H17E-10 TaxID=2932244 RepID=UPI001FD3A17E|nr:alpha/beta hydrolase [Agromyces sp. H17E-10]UOQ90093.1 alpha/beta hydrolase [Agromyces sp. H17E-10]
MDTPASQKVAADAETWSPPLPEALGFEHSIVETPGLRTHVATIGEGEPVVLLHGFPEHWWMWRDVAPRLAKAGYRAVCPDLRGTGWTEADDPRIGAESYVADLVALLDALDLERPRFLAHDMGAIPAMQLAYRHPERVRSLVQLSVPPFFMGFSAELVPGFRHMPRLLLHRRGGSLDWLYDDAHTAHRPSAQTIATYLAPLSRPEVDSAVRRIFGGMAIPMSLRFARGDYRRRRLQPPTLIAFGRLDHPWDEALIRRLCRGADRYADDLELAFVDDAAHFIVDDAPGAVAELVLDWFGRTGASDRTE